MHNIVVAHIYSFTFPTVRFWQWVTLKCNYIHQLYIWTEEMYSYKYWLQQKRKAAMKLNARYCTTMCYKTGKLNAWNQSATKHIFDKCVYKISTQTTKQAIYVLFSILWPQWWVGRCTRSGGYQVSGKERIWRWWNTSQGCVPPDQASWLYLGLGVWEESVVEQMTDRNTLGTWSTHCFSSHCSLSSSCHSGVTVYNCFQAGCFSSFIPSFPVISLASSLAPQSFL